MRRWKKRKLMANCFVEFNGKPVTSVKKVLRTAVGVAKLPGRVTPHTLRHTAATWLMQRGVPIWGAAWSRGCHQRSFRTLTAIITLTISREPQPLSGKTADTSVVETVVDLTDGLNQTKKPNDIWSEWQDLNLRPLRPERSALPG
jgi:hypothetical protein